MNELMALFEQFPAYYIGVLFLFGACVGSFLNVVIYRLPNQLFWQWRIQCREILELSESETSSSPPGIIQPRSHCKSCKNNLTLFQNIPILGYIFLRGKCGFCQESISLRYPIVELGTALLWVQLGMHFGLGLPLAFSLVLISCFVVLGLIDFDHQILPDVIVIPLIWLGLIANSLGLFTDLQSALYGAVFGYLVLWTVYQVHHRITGKEGMGYGDFKLLACIGAWLGWEILPIVILLASLSGTIIAVSFMMFRRQGKEVAVAFGPYLVIAGWIALLWADPIITHYFQLFRL